MRELRLHNRNTIRPVQPKPFIIIEGKQVDVPCLDADGNVIPDYG